MEDILLPKERRDAVVLIGVDERDSVEFVRIYAVSEERAKRVLEEFFNAKGLFPTDYRLVSRGTEPVGDRKAITTRSETALSSALARLGLRLLSNGILYLDGVETLYQITLVSESLYSSIAGKEVEKPPQKRKPGVFPSPRRFSPWGSTPSWRTFLAGTFRSSFLKTLSFSESHPLRKSPNFSPRRGITQLWSRPKTRGDTPSSTLRLS